MADYNINNIVSYRKGYVLRGQFCNVSCCHRSIENGVVFEYVEMIDRNDNHFFAYEDEEMFKNYETNFHNKRFTAFNEFFTTEEIAEDNTSGFPLKYYVRRPYTDYIITSIDELLSSLDKIPDCQKLSDRNVQWGQYDKTVDYHFDN